ncbi:hypothetical protein GDO78_003230 [Eleutherodactylus coqui]|uniref:Uncharacterized protein n=1 Tax=Eleutherodactylus coqui TaxID=57060 RepID=A0A8J6EXM4_ELECQ|nr:hypothetical protein GDO78_003230 [Eleutherodactylus coqui]
MLAQILSFLHISVAVIRRFAPIELIKTLFTSWCDRCSWPSGTQFVSHVAVSTIETSHPPDHCVLHGLSCQTLFCQFPPAVIYRVATKFSGSCQEGSKTIAIPPTSTTDNIRGVNLRATFVYMPQGVRRCHWEAHPLGHRNT